MSKVANTFCQPSVLIETPAHFVYNAESTLNKILQTYNIFLAHLPSKSSMSGQRHHQKTLLQMHPTIHCPHPVRDKNQEFESILLQIAHFTVTGENEAGVDLVLIQPFLLYHGNHVVLRLNSIFKQNFHKKRKGVCTKTRVYSCSQHILS